jgi:hypothetical protein
MASSFLAAAAALSERNNQGIGREANPMHVRYSIAHHHEPMEPISVNALQSAVKCIGNLFQTLAFKLEKTANLFNQTRNFKRLTGFLERMEMVADSTDERGNID